MPTISRLPVLLRCDIFGSTKDIKITTPRVPLGNDVMVNLAFFYGGGPLNCSNISSILFEIVNGSADDSPRLISKTIVAADITATIAPADFAAGIAWNLQIPLTATEMNPDLAGAASKSYTVIISGVTTDGTMLTYGTCGWVIYDDGTSGTSGSPPDVNPSIYYTKDQVDALLAGLSGGGGGGGGSSGVSSVNTRTGAVTLTAADVGLSSVNNTADSAKPVSTAQAAALALKANANAVVPLITFVFDGAGSAIAAGSTTSVVPRDAACTITAWTLIGDQSGSAVVDIQTATGGGSSFSSICGSAKPTLSSARRAPSSGHSTTLTGWTAAVAADTDFKAAIVGTPSTVTQLTLVVFGTYP